MDDLTEADIARIIRDVENGGRYIHGMMPEAAARAIVMAAADDKRNTLIQALEFYANNYVDEGDTARMALREWVAVNHALIEALEFYADNLIDGGSKARMALQLRATRKARRPDDVVR